MGHSEDGEGATRPTLGEQEAPLRAEDLAALLRALPPQATLVGGQALAFWMARYRLIPHGAAEDAGITSDADLLGSAEDARHLALHLQGRLVLAPKRALSSLVGQVRVPVLGAMLERNVDILHKLYDSGGMRKSTDFTRRAIARATVVEFEPGWRLRVLHPLDVLASRVHNAVGLLRDKGPHVLTQLRWSITVASHALLRAAQLPMPGQRAGRLAQEVLGLATSSAGCQLHQKHGIEVFDAVPLRELSRINPSFKTQAETMRKALLRSRA